MTEEEIEVSRARRRTTCRTRAESTSCWPPTASRPAWPACAPAARPLARSRRHDAAAAGFKTYVIGIAIEPEGVATLNQMAIAGGVPRIDPTPSSTRRPTRPISGAALNVITGQVSNCVFPLGKPPPAPDSVKVTVDGARVPQSATDGWSYTSDQNTAIQLNGMWCEKVKTARPRWASSSVVPTSRFREPFGRPARVLVYSSRGRMTPLRGHPPARAASVPPATRSRWAPGCARWAGRWASASSTRRSSSACCWWPWSPASTC